MPMATNEPKVSSSTTIAATIPIAGRGAQRRLLDLLDGLAAELDLHRARAGAAGDARSRA